VIVRTAKKSDKEEVLKFCSNTFEWGDYIDQVWDIWSADPHGKLYVVDHNERSKNNNNFPVAISHGIICPGKRQIWLEGIRVHPDHRRKRIATALIAKMMQFGMRQGAIEASAVVATANIGSRLMLENNGFSVISRWVYYTSTHKTVGSSRIRHTNARVASLEDLNDVCNYLTDSPIYKLSGKRYVKAWRWYFLNRNTLRHFIKKRNLIVTGYPSPNGIALLNRRAYWHGRDALQIVYLDSLSKSSLQNLVAFLTNLRISSTKPPPNSHSYVLQLLAYQSEHLSVVMKNFNIKESEQFLLYARRL
jgi:GNAT superfamily N-acetyltransferase